MIALSAILALTILFFLVHAFDTVNGLAAAGWSMAGALLLAYVLK